MSKRWIKETLYERRAAGAFDLQATVFDELFANDSIVQYKRERVRAQVVPFLKTGDRILELNAGTGEDALYFSSLGFSVHATDISENMQRALQVKVRAAHMDHLVTSEICSFNRLYDLKERGPYDHIFSNFGGLNCTNELDQVLWSCVTLLKPGGILHIVVMPPFCLWETLLLLKGKCRTATRRWLHAGKGASAQVEGKAFKCWYYKPSAIRRAMKGIYTFIQMEGLCTFVPPSYLQGFDKKYPSLFRKLCKLEGKMKSRKPWNALGDYYIMSLQKPILL